MVQTGKRIRLLAIALAIAAMAAIMALSLNLRVRADDNEIDWSEYEIFNVYVADTQAKAQNFINEHPDETGWTKHPNLAAPYHQVATANTMYNAFGTKLNAIASQITEATANGGKVWVNVWVLQDTTTNNTSSATYLFSSTQALKDVNGADIPVHVTGVKAPGSDEYPVFKHIPGKGFYSYLGGASVVFKNITVEMKPASANSTAEKAGFWLFCLGHEFVAEENVQFYGVNGPAGERNPITIIGTEYKDAIYSNDGYYNGIGEYGSYKEDSFAAKITLKSGIWNAVCPVYGGAGFGASGGAGSQGYNFNDPKQADFYITVDGTAKVKTLLATPTLYKSFVGGPNCTLHYDLKGGYVGQVFAGPVSDVTTTEKIDNTRQYFNVVVNSYDGVTVGQIMGQAGNHTAYSAGTGTDADHPLFIFGDITYNLYGGTFDAKNSVIQEDLGLTDLATMVRPLQGASSGNGGVTPEQNQCIMLGTIKLVIGDPENPGNGPTIVSSATNAIAPSFGATVGLTGTGSAAAFIGQSMYKEGSTFSEDKTLGEWAKEHAGVVFEMHGGNISACQVNLGTEYSKVTTFTMDGGTIDKVEFLHAHKVNKAGFTGGDHENNSTGLTLDLSGSAVLGTIQTNNNLAGIYGDLNVTATGVTFKTVPDFLLRYSDATKGSTPIEGNVTMSFENCTLPSLSVLKQTTNITGNLDVTLDGCTVNGDITTAVAGATVTGSANLILKTCAKDLTLGGNIIAPEEGFENLTVKAIAGDYTLYKTSTSAITLNELAASAETPLNLATIDGSDWTEGVSHLTVKAIGITEQVQVVPGPSSTLKGEEKDGVTVWTAVNYALDAADYFCTIRLGDSYAVRYLIPRELVDFYGKDNVTVTYTVDDPDSETGPKTETATLADGSDDGYPAYYFFLVEGIYAKNYAKTKITVTVSVNGQSFSPVKEGTVADALATLQEEEGHEDLAKAIINYAAAMEAWFYKGDGQADYSAVTKASAEAMEWAEGLKAGTNSRLELAQGVWAYGVNLTVTDTIQLNFWLLLEGEGMPEEIRAQIQNGDQNGFAAVAPEGIQQREPSGDDYKYYTVSYRCGAGDLYTMLQMQVNGGDAVFEACPLYYAVLLYGDGAAEHSPLAEAIMEYAYQVKLMQDAQQQG